MLDQSELISQAGYGDDFSFIASMELYQTKKGVVAICQVADEDKGDVVPVPPHLAAQIPMAIMMIRSQNGD